MNIAQHVRDPDRYYDRTIQQWHALELPRTYSAIDIDLLGFCAACSGVLYLIEASETESKPTTVIAKIGAQLGVPALLVLHRSHRFWKARLVDRGGWHDEAETAAYLHYLRGAHTCR